MTLGMTIGRGNGRDQIRRLRMYAGFIRLAGRSKKALRHNVLALYWNIKGGPQQGMPSGSNVKRRA
jgi:hypothetical protein